MTIVTKEQVIQSIEKLPQERLEEAWLYLEFLSSKTARPNQTAVPDNPEGAFPELDISLDTIQRIDKTDWQQRLSRILPEN